MKRYIFVLFSIIFIFSFNINAFAQSNLSVTYDEWINYIDDVENDNNAVSQALRMLGFVASDVKFALKVPAATVKDILGIPSDTTIKDYIKSKTSRSDDDKPVVDSDLHDGLKQIANYYINETKSYVYSLPLDYNSGSFYNLEQFNIAKQSIITMTNDRNRVYFCVRGNDGRTTICGLNIDAHPYLCFIKRNQNAVSSHQVNVLPYDGNANAYIQNWDFCYVWDTTNLEYTTVENARVNQNTNYTCTFQKGDKYNTYTIQYLGGTMINVSPHTFKYFDSINDVSNDDLLYQPYYYNNRSWSNFDTSTGDYTVDNSNYNPITYGDITNYINSFNTENGVPPSMEDINEHIKNTDDDNNSGGGSGGSGSVDDDDDGGSIFDWLKNLGKVLGDLIKGVGEFITEIIAGLVSALNDLMSSLSGLITDTLGSLTSVFSSIIDFVYAGLPDSVKGIMMLALTVSLLITVIQLIRK